MKGINFIQQDVLFNSYAINNLIHFLKYLSTYTYQGKEFDETTTDGRKCKTTVTKEGDNKLVTKQIAQDGKKNVTVIREFSDKGIDVQMICEDVTSKQFFERK